MSQENENKIIEKNDSRPNCVVGIGASAGGLEAIQQFLSFLPIDTDMSYIIIQHLSPEHKSLMAEIIAKYTTMPVFQAENGMIIEKNAIYLIPPKYNMVISSDGELTLKEYNHDELNHPIDIFMNTLSEAYQDKAIAVVLSGTGSDGTNGICSIKEHNGVIIVQNPENSKFDGMPRNAISTGFVDLILNPEEIAKEMHHISLNMTATERIAKMTDEDMISQVYGVLRKASKVDYSYYKQSTIMRRIERRMVIVHKTSLREYISYLSSNMDEAKILAKEVLIGVTNFFRDKDYFEVLKNKALRAILEKSDSQDQIRIWIAGCSTGEEAYSIAILLSELMEEMSISREVKIFATDLDNDAVLFASKGIYRENIMNDVGVERLARYFTKKGNKYIINHEIRKMIVFAQHNVFQDPPFGKLDMISCRNMMIYFQTVLQQELFSIFHVALKDSGFLFLGKSEAVSHFDNVFLPYCNGEKIFIHNAGGRTPLRRSISYKIPSLDSTSGSRIQEEEPFVNDVEYDSGDLYLKSLETLMPACVLVNGQNELKHSFGDCSEYIGIPVGAITLDIFTLVIDDLKIAVSTALKEAREQNSKVVYDQIPVHGKDGLKNITLIVQPMRDKKGKTTNLFGVVFSEQKNLEDSNAVHYDIDVIASKRISDLEGELKESQSNLKATVSELESVNAELQAANEELLTANEELQSSNEELQSVNEELYTVNSEYQEKVKELGDVNDDMSNFLSTTLVGIMFVDKNLNIRKCTEYITEEFDVGEQDIGRPLQMISYNFVNTNIIELSKTVSQTLSPIEQNIVSITGKTFLLRIAPYRTENSKVVGLVLTFVDSSKRQSDQEQLDELSEALKSAVKKSKEKENFLSKMSHDMRTPMTSIIGIVDLLLDNPNTDSTTREGLAKVHNASQLLLNLINEVLETSKIDAGKMTTQMEITSERTIIDGPIAVIKELSSNKEIHFVCDIDKIEDRSIMADCSHMSRVILNLLSNAVKYTQEGGEVVFSDVAEYHVDSVIHTYRIKDNGCGISKVFQAKMYLPFEQEMNETTKTGEGTGLGLFICQQLVHLLGGTIECISSSEEGTTFTVTMEYKLVSDEQLRLRQKIESSVILDSLRGKRVMICEDHKVNAGIIKALVDKVGMETILASNGQEAVDKFKGSDEGTIDVILMDIRMPVMNGLDATSKIRGMDRMDAKVIPIIALTADTFDNQIKDCMNVGMTNHVAKPINPKVLYDTMIESMDK